MVREIRNDEKKVETMGNLTQIRSGYFKEPINNDIQTVASSGDGNIPLDKFRGPRPLIRRHNNYPN